MRPRRWRFKAKERRRTNKRPGVVTAAFLRVMRRVLLLLLSMTCVARAERINQEGRILGPAPVVTTPTLFNTAAADAIVSAMQIMPRDNPWNEDVSRRPVHQNSDAIITQITADLSASRRTLRPFYEMNYVLV